MRQHSKSTVALGCAAVICAAVLGVAATPGANSQVTAVRLATESDATGPAAAVIAAARRWIGTPYSWGGGTLSGPSLGQGTGAHTVGFDCSGYTRYAFQRGAGITLPRTAAAQYTETIKDLVEGGGPDDLGRLQPGDLLFWKNSGRIHHVALYVGHGNMLEEPQTGAVAHLVPVYDGDFYAATRPLARMSVPTNTSAAPSRPSSPPAHRPTPPARPAKPSAAPGRPSRPPAHRPTPPARPAKPSAAPRPATTPPPQQQQPYTPERVCGDGYRLIDQARLPRSTVYLLWNGTAKANCVVTLKTSDVGVATSVTAWLQPDGKSATSDSGAYKYYAGPVRAYAPSCITWGGSDGAGSYTSPSEHCRS